MIIGGTEHLHLTHLLGVSTCSLRAILNSPNSHVSELSLFDFKSIGRILSSLDAVNENNDKSFDHFN